MTFYHNIIIFSKQNENPGRILNYAPRGARAAGRYSAGIFEKPDTIRYRRLSPSVVVFFMRFSSMSELNQLDVVTVLIGCGTDSNSTLAQPLLGHVAWQYNGSTVLHCLESARQYFCGTACRLVCYSGCAKNMFFVKPNQSSILVWLQLFPNLEQSCTWAVFLRWDNLIPVKINLKKFAY